MKKKLMALCSSLTILYSLFLLPQPSLAQSVGIGTTSPDPSAQLDIRNTSKGLLIPRMTTSAINSITSPAKGLMVYDSAKNQLMVNMGTAAIHNWQTIISKSGWSLTGNSGTDTSNFIGTVSNSPLLIRVRNIRAGIVDSATQSVSLGFRALQSNGTGVENTAIGYKSLITNESGYSNSAFGSNALKFNQTGSSNTAIGTASLLQNLSGSQNTAIGDSALYSNTSGIYNTATGSYGLANNSTGNLNTSIGAIALLQNSTGEGNTAIGYEALRFNSSGAYNTAVGLAALVDASGSISNYNTAVGTSALALTTNSQYNTAVGYYASAYYDAGYNNTFLGAFSDINQPALFNCIAIGKTSTCTGPSEAVIGNSSTAVIGGFVNWSLVSDGRFKKDVHENVAGLDFIMKLRPVTYHLDVTGISKKLNEGRDKELDQLSKDAITAKEKTRFTGFVAQEVEQAANESGFDFSGVVRPENENGFYRLRYAEFVVPLVKAMQEQQAMIKTLNEQVEAAKAEIVAETREQQQEVAELKKQIEYLQIQFKKLKSPVIKN